MTVCREFIRTWHRCLSRTLLYRVMALAPTWIECCTATRAEIYVRRSSASPPGNAATCLANVFRRKLCPRDFAALVVAVAVTTAPVAVAIASVAVAAVTAVSVAPCRVSSGLSHRPVTIPLC